MLYFLSVLVSAIPPLVVFFLLKKHETSRTKVEDIRNRVEKIKGEIQEILSMDLEAFFPREAFESLKAKKDELKAEITSIQSNLKIVEEKVKELSAKLEEKEKFHQQMKLPNPEIEELAIKTLQQIDKAMERVSYIETQMAEKLSSLESLQLQPDLLPFKNNLQEITLQFGSLARNFLLLLKDIKEKILSLRSQISDLELEFAKLLEKQVS